MINMNDIIEITKLIFAFLEENPQFLSMLIFGLIFTLTMINGTIILPLIFNFKIIPEIEKKVEQKLEYWSEWKGYFIFWKFGWPYIEVSQYIFFKYLTKKTNINFTRLINRNFALKKINYDIRKASRFEIVMSFSVVLNWCLSFICAISILLIGHYYNIH